MVRKKRPFRQLCLKSERICAGMAVRCPRPAVTLAGVNGYAPEKGAVERICSGIGGLRHPESVGFSIVLGVLPTEWGANDTILSFPHPRKSPRILNGYAPEYVVFEEMYEKMVRKEFPRTLENLRKDSLTKVVVLLDYAEGDPRKWLNHAAIMKRMIEEDQTEHGLAA